MRKLLLIDGNSMLFRAYYGTLSRGLMKSSSGVVTNAVYGFSTMLNKAFELLKPTHVLIAFDTGDKTFRHSMFDAYKGTRKEVDEDLVSQFALVREFIDASGIQRYELSGYEADDIIGTLAKKYTDDEVTILTSDRDLLQIVDDHVRVMLMKKGLTDLVTVDVASLYEESNMVPSQIIDLKALMGDSSDNIPGVPSVGDKTARKLLAEYQTLDGVYEHADEIKGKLGENIRTYKDQAYLSYELAKICVEVPVTIDIESFELQVNTMSTNAFYRKYDMNSLITEDKDTSIEEEIPHELEFSHFDMTWIGNDAFVFLERDKQGEIVGFHLSDGVRNAYVLPQEAAGNDVFVNFLEKSHIIASESKPLYRWLLDNGKSSEIAKFDDLLLLAFVVNSGINTLEKLRDEYNLWYADTDSMSAAALFARNGFDSWDKLVKDAKKDNVLRVYESIEKPLTHVLAKAEDAGFNVSRDTLHQIAEETHAIIEKLSASIQEYAGTEFNLNSPKQLAEILFDTLKLPMIKKRSTAVDVLDALHDKHPIIPALIGYRKYQKLYSTYAIGLQKHIRDDGKIHTTLNQHATQTGRLSSLDPNLQNISVRDEEGKRIRSAFVASPGNVLLSVDYSQIELRVLSYLANEEKMMSAFNNQRDIHEETAKDIFSSETVSSLQRRKAKSVNFGIIYGMSDYGLSQQLDIPVSEASSYIKRYHEVYPRISEYMNAVIAKCEEEGYVDTFFGRRRYISEIFDKNRAVREFGKRAAMNAPIQGTAADIIKLAMVLVDRQLDSFKTKMILQVHDELVFDVPKHELEAVTAMIVKTMETVVEWPIALKVSTAVGATWMEK